MMHKIRTPQTLLKYSFFLIFLFVLKSVEAQNLVNVNNVTGTANVKIPIYTATVGELSAPLGLSYTASGLKVEDYDNSIGLGWHLVGGGMISRRVKGFPDDVEFQSHSTYSTIKGWLRSGNTAPQTIQSLTLANPGNCADEISDATTIGSYFDYTHDTEPDEFYVSAPGLNCTFVFDGTTNHDFKIIPYRDYKITKTLDPYGSGKIIAFTITNENGVKYYFDRPNWVTHYISTYNPGASTETSASSLEVFKRDFLMYRSKSSTPVGTKMDYADQWALSIMEDMSGNKIAFDYYSHSIVNPEIEKRTSTKEVEILKPNGSGGFTKKLLYIITKEKYDQRLTYVYTYAVGGLSPTWVTEATLDWGPPSYDPAEEQKLRTVTLPLDKKIYELIFSDKFLANSSVWYGYGRYFLMGLKMYKSGNICDNINTQFDFTYYNVNQADHTCYCTPTVGGTPVTTIVNAQDYWGYYNGQAANTSLDPQIYVYPDYAPYEIYKTYPIPSHSGTEVILASSNDRTVSSNAKDGSLKTITNPTGGVTEFEYENNDFYDADVNGAVLGGGIRVKKISSNDGLNNVTETSYGYNDPSTGVTTGRAISVPKFAMAFQNSGSYSTLSDRVKNSTYMTTYDLNDESKEIIYGKVTLSKTGNGKSIYEYNTTGTFRSSSATDWNETTNYYARTNLSSPTPCTAIAPAFLTPRVLQYPFTSNNNFDFERGLLNKVTTYNSSNQVVASEEYTYDRSHQDPERIYALKLDEIGNTMAAYGKYTINATVDNFLVSKVSKVHNSSSPTSTVYNEDAENYTYTPKNSILAYRILKAIDKTNSDGVTMTSKFTYAKEYTALGTGDDMDKSIYEFNTNNKNVLIETSQHRTPFGLSETTLGATLNMFKPVTFGYYNNITRCFPDKTYQFINQAGTSFTPSTLSSGTFSKDNTNYVNNPTTVESYSYNGMAKTIFDNSRIPKTVINYTTFNLKTAEFINARSENVAYSNFDIYYAPTEVDFNNSSSLSYTDGRHSTFALNFTTSTTLCKLITRSPTAKNLIVSFWLKDAASNGNIYICGNKFSTACIGTSCSSGTAIPFTASSEWKYYQVTIPYNAFGTTMAYSLGTSVNVKIDDIMIYPDNASFTTYGYTTNNIGTNMLTAKTGLNGIGQTYEYDKAGRLWLTRDQFENIIEMKKYKLTNQYLTQIPDIVIGYSPTPYALGDHSIFSVSLPRSYIIGDCGAPTISYHWDFGDPASGPLNTANSVGDAIDGHSGADHIYGSVGKYLVTVTASSPGMTNVIGYTAPVTNTSYPYPVTVVASAPSCTGGGTPVICAAGIVQRTSAGVCVLSYCSPMAATCNDTNFQLTGITGGSMTDVYSVEWEYATPGYSDWATMQAETVGTGGFQTSVHFHPVHTTSYQVRAKIKFCNSSGSTAYSNSITVLNGD